MDPASPSFGTKDGSCGYGLIPKDKYPYFSTAAFAPSNRFYQADELNACGQCFQIQCTDPRAGVCKTDSAGKPLSVKIMISDECPECGADHIDVQSLTFAKLADLGIGRIAIQYRRIECTPPDDMKVSVMDYRGANGWIRLSIDDTGGRAAVRSVAVRGGSGDWKPLTNSWGATWEMGSAPAPPLSFKIVGDDGEEVEASNVIKQDGGISNGAFGERATFSAGVQFSIRDPAFQAVQAFDGPSNGDPMLITSDTPTEDGTGANASSPVPSSGKPAAPSGKPSGKPAPSTSTASASKDCVDVPAPGEHSCQQQKDWGKCYEGWFQQGGFCALTCGRCGPGAGPAPPPGCSDVPTPVHTCAEQKAWGKCGEPFIKSNGYCKASCGACSAPGATVEAFDGPFAPAAGRRLRAALSGRRVGPR